MSPISVRVIYWSSTGHDKRLCKVNGQLVLETFSISYLNVNTECVLWKVC